jgi:hypothetical protein
VQLSPNPLLAPTLPAWRSRIVLFAIFAMFAALAARALWLQVIANEFVQEQGASRYARTLKLYSPPKASRRACDGWRRGTAACRRHAEYFTTACFGCKLGRNIIQRRI